MDTRSLNVLHDTRNKDILAVAHCIYLNFLTYNILVYKNRVLLNLSVDDIHKFNHIIIRYSNLHSLSAKYIGRSYKYRITKLMGST